MVLAEAGDMANKGCYFMSSEDLYTQYTQDMREPKDHVPSSLEL